MDIIIESEEDYKAWLAEKKTIAESMAKEEAPKVELTEAVEEGVHEAEVEELDSEAETEEITEEPAHS